MERDIKDVVGSLMRVAGGGEMSQDEVLDLEFEADGELLDEVNSAYIKLLEFAYDRELRLRDPAYDFEMRQELQQCLDKITSLCAER
jgi:hypothetical protein